MGERASLGGSSFLPLVLTSVRPQSCYGKESGRCLVPKAGGGGGISADCWEDIQQKESEA